MIGNGGRDLWEHLPKPINFDQFTINQINLHFKQTKILFPSNDYSLPLQKLGRFLGFAKPSEIQIDINPEFGLWFAYRGVFLTEMEISTAKCPYFVTPCDSCNGKPCLKETEIEKARLACPYQKQHQYKIEQLNYHRAQLALLK